MPLFLVLYIAGAVAVSIIIFILSFLEKDRKPIKIALAVIYIVSIVAVLFATGCLEEEYAYSKLYTSVLALAIVFCMYGADSLGGKLAHRKEDKTDL